MDLKNMRLNYTKSKIDFENLEKDPLTFFLKWIQEAIEVDKNEANACVLSTISAHNKPLSRVVLLKDISTKGFTFFTNYKSEKAINIKKNNSVALNFYWPELERQVRVNGIAKKINAKDSDDYFKERPKESQLGSLLSNQSSVIDIMYNFDNSFKKIKEKYKNQKIKRPKYWGGYCVIPEKIEFWQGRPSRFHDRILYEFDGKIWNLKRLAP
ncbi:MAG: pyridoxamine 5'-phosphate oxidase [Flavobacteriales bacterium]|nr:pyridoxamine 5'-phosphate oxidase [Flavobacteriales bacterium]